MREKVPRSRLRRKHPTARQAAEAWNRSRRRMTACGIRAGEMRGKHEVLPPSERSASSRRRRSPAGCAAGARRIWVMPPRNASQDSSRRNWRYRLQVLRAGAIGSTNSSWMAIGYKFKSGPAREAARRHAQKPAPNPEQSGCSHARGWIGPLECRTLQRPREG